MPTESHLDHGPHGTARRARFLAPTGPVSNLVATGRRLLACAPIALLVIACATGTAAQGPVSAGLATPGTATPGKAAPSPAPAMTAPGSASPRLASPGPALSGPNAGRVLFGDSYDHATFVLTAPTSQVMQGRDIAFVAHFQRRVVTGQVHVLVVLGGKVILDRAIAVTNGPWSVYGARIPGSKLSEPGGLLVRFMDDASVLLSSGTLTVTPGPMPSPSDSTPRPS